MLKLWMVIYILGEVAATVGPITSYDMTECQRQAVVKWANIDDNFSGHGDDGRLVTKSDIEYRCQFAERRPGFEETEK